MDSLIYSLNVIVPIFIVVGVGYFLRSFLKPDERFIGTLNKLLFYVGLSCLVFCNTYEADLKSFFNLRLIGFCLAFVCLEVLLLFVIVPRLVKNRKSAGAIIQASFRSNFLLLGYPLAISMFGIEGAQPVALMLPFIIFIYNIFAVLCLTVFSETPKGFTLKQLIKVIREIFTNPLVVASILAVIAKLMTFAIPYTIYKPVADMAGMASPLALLLLGMQLDFKHLTGNLRLSLPTAVVRLVIVPVFAVAAAVWLGFRGSELGAVFVIFASATAVSSYIMAYTLGSDYKLAGELVILTTILCPFTLFIGIFILKMLVLI